MVRGERASDNMMSKCHLVTHFKPLWSSRLRSITGSGAWTHDENQDGGIWYQKQIFLVFQRKHRPSETQLKKTFQQSSNDSVDFDKTASCIKNKIRTEKKCFHQLTPLSVELRTRPVSLQWYAGGPGLLRSPHLINPGINHTLPVPRGERDESGGELEIMLMSRQVSPPLWPFQKLLILLVVSGLEIITSSNPCNTAWPAEGPGQFEAWGGAGQSGGGAWDRERGSEWESARERVTNYPALSPVTEWMMSCSLQLWPLALTTLI